MGEKEGEVPDWFRNLCARIKSLEIQGAENIARSAVEGAARMMSKGFWSKSARDLILSTRPTEPMMHNALLYLEAHAKHGVDNAQRVLLKQLEEADSQIADNAIGLIKNDLYATHCHSSTVLKAFILAKKRGIRFSVHNTETRPLFQGRLTSSELARHKIPVSHFVDSAARLSLKGAKALFLGADALLSDGTIVNKIGSEMLSELARARRIEVYILASSWKYAQQNRKDFKSLLENRSPEEVWPKSPPGVHVENPAFEFVSPNLITAIITEIGIHPPKEQAKLLDKLYRKRFKS